MTTALLWSADYVNNFTTLTLNDSIDNYDELHYYCSGTRNGGAHVINTVTEYPVVPGIINQGGPMYCGLWDLPSNLFILCNGTQCWLSGNSGYVNSSFFWGNSDTTATTYIGSLPTNRTHEVRPYKIVGVKYDS